MGEGATCGQGVGGESGRLGGGGGGPKGWGGKKNALTRSGLEGPTRYPPRHGAEGTRINDHLVAHNVHSRRALAGELLTSSGRGRCWTHN